MQDPSRGDSAADTACNINSNLMQRGLPQVQVVCVQVVVTDVPVVQSTPSCPVQQPRPAAGTACGAPIRADRAGHCM